MRVVPSHRVGLQVPDAPTLSPGPSPRVRKQGPRPRAPAEPGRSSHHWGRRPGGSTAATVAAPRRRGPVWQEGIIMTR